MADSQALIGQNVSQYRIQQEMGADGGEVCAAYYSALSHPVVMNFLSLETQAIKSTPKRLLSKACGAPEPNYPVICKACEVSPVWGST
jgi:hypothetical protein